MARRDVGLFCQECHSTTTALGAMVEWSCCPYGCARPLRIVVRPVALAPMLRSEGEED